MLGKYFQGPDADLPKKKVDSKTFTTFSCKKLKLLNPLKVIHSIEFQLKFERVCPLEAIVIINAKFNNATHYHQGALFVQLCTKIHE